MSITNPRIAGFVTRAEAGLRRPRSVSRNISPQLGGVALHYGGWNIPTTNHASCIRRWKSWQDYHMGKNWADIAYTMGVCQHGYAFAGRGAGVRTAGQGTNAGNNTHYAVCWIGGEQQKVSEAALSAYAWCINELRSAGKAGRSVKPHRYFKSTGCPGSTVAQEAAKVDGRIIKAGGSPVTNCTANVFGEGDEGDCVKDIQANMNKLGFDAGAVDGDFGPATDAAVRRFQAEAKLEVDGLVGPNTWDAIAKALKPEPKPDVNFVTVGDDGSKVKSWQQKLLKWDSNALPEYGADGDFGGETVEWTLKFMDAVKISVADRDRPRVGPKTLEAMDKALKPKPKPEPEPEPEPEPKPEPRKASALLLTRIDGSDTVYQMCGPRLLALGEVKQAEAIVRLAGLKGSWQDHVGNITAEDAEAFEKV